MGVPWMGGEGHGEPGGDTLEGGKPDKESKKVILFTSLREKSALICITNLFCIFMSLTQVMKVF